MKVGTSSLVTLLLVMLATTTQAMPTLVNFQTLADASSSASPSYGESAWGRETADSASTHLNLNHDFGIDVSLYGDYGTNEAYAYLDRGHAGLGVCRQLKSGVQLGPRPGLGSNICKDASDDNVKGAGEALKMVFNESIRVTNIWFNNNHDPDYGLTGDTITIGGIDHTFSGSAGDANLGWAYSFSGSDGVFALGDSLSLAYYTGSSLRAEEFYVSAIEFESVPEPASLAMIAIGLLGMGGIRRHATTV